MAPLVVMAWRLTGEFLPKLSIHKGEESPMLAGFSKKQRRVVASCPENMRGDFPFFTRRALVGWGESW